MRTQISKFIPLLELLASLPNKETLSYLKNAPSPVIKFITDFVYNVYIGTLKVEISILHQIKSQKNLIKKLCQKKISLNERKKIISRPQFFFKVVVPLIPSLIESISS